MHIFMHKNTRKKRVRDQTKLTNKCVPDGKSETTNDKQTTSVDVDV